MSSLALMRFLETAPERYDAGMRVLTLGRVSRLHDALAEAAAADAGARILEIGCGTGAVTARLVARGACVTALDQNPAMIEQARARLASTREGAVTWMERTASEIDSLPEAAFDAVVMSFSLSEMSSSERGFVLRQSLRRLRPGGTLAAGDEVRPRRGWQRLLRAIAAAPQILLAWIAVGSTSRPIADLRAEVREAGFHVRGERRWLLGTLSLVTAEAPR
jgi:ubiquinone/menaquinone biosynthesis C-methylase UbiE